RKASLRLTVGNQLLGLDDLAARVVPAVRADRVLQLRLLALRAGLQIGQVERQVRAPPPLASLGQLYLRKSHDRRGSLAIQEQYELQLVPDRDPVVTELGDLRLDRGPDLVVEPRTKRRQAHPPALVKAQRVQVVVGGDQPEA